MKLNEVQVDPEILVVGVGKMTLHQAIHRAQEMLTDLTERANREPTAQNWNSIATLFDRKVLQSYVSSIARALREIQ